MVKDMIIQTLQYHDRFFCLADQCPNTCCANWNIPIDRKTRARYHALEGPIGDLARNALNRSFFRTRKDGRCSFLMDNGLCSMMIVCGGSQEYLSYVCATYPRKISDFGSRRHISLSVSCPMAADLLLHQNDVIRFVQIKTNELPQPNTIDAERFKKLIGIHDDCVTTIQQTTDDFFGTAEKILQAYGISFCLNDLRPLFKTVQLFQGMQYNDPKLNYALKDRKHFNQVIQNRDTVLNQYDLLLKNLMLYMFDRYIMEAIDDGDYLSRIKLCIIWCMMFFLLLCDSSTSLQQDDVKALLVDFARQTEHCDHNLIRLMRKSIRVIAAP